MGWYREFLPMAQPYSGPGSPYWASKGFLGLLLPANHPVWTAREEPMPVERDDFCRAMPEPGFLVRGTRADGVVRVSSHKSDHYPFLGEQGDDPHYRKLAYSTHTGPDVEESSDEDCQITLLSRDLQISRRAHVHPIAVVDRMAASVFCPGEPAVVRGAAFPVWLERVETFSIARGVAEIRIHHVSTFGRRRVRDGGFAIADDRPLEVESGDDWCLVHRHDGLVSGIFALHGFGSADATRRTGANAFGRYSAAPYLVSREEIPAEGLHRRRALLRAARGARAGRSNPGSPRALRAGPLRAHLPRRNRVRPAHLNTGG
jgi:hypothetical protein